MLEHDSSRLSSHPVTRRIASSMLASLALCALTLAGCSSGPSRSDGASARMDARRSVAGDRSTVPHEAYAEIGYRLVWRGFPIMADGAQPLFLDVFGDTLLVHNSENVVTLMESSSGANRWSNDLADRLTRFVGNVRRGNRLYCSSDNELYVLDHATGEILDRQSLDLVVDTKPVIASNVAVYGTSIGQALGHSLVTRLKAWAYQLEGSISARPTRIGNLVGVVSQGGSAIVLDPQTGSSMTRARIYDGLENRPVSSDDAMFVASLDQSIYAISARGGDIIWRYRTEYPIRSQPVYHDGVLYCTVPREGFVAFDSATGDVLWRAADVAGRAIGIRAGRLLVWDGQQCAALDPDNGDLLASATLPGVQEIETTSFVDGELFTISPDGIVAKFTTR